MIIIHSSCPFISLQPLTVVAAIQLCVAVKTLYLMSIYTGTMRLNLMFHHWDHCWCARGGGRDNHPCVLPDDNRYCRDTGHSCDGLALTLPLIQTQSSGVIIAILRQQFAMQGPKYDPKMFIQNVKGGHTFPLSVWAVLDWPNGRPAVRHSPHSLRALCWQIDITHSWPIFMFAQWNTSCQTI